MSTNPEEKQQSNTAQSHPFVSERNEGKLWCMTVVAILVGISAIVGVLGYAHAATVILAVTACTSAAIRLIMRDQSPWKVRSVAFDVFIGFALGIGLIVTDISILVM